LVIGMSLGCHWDRLVIGMSLGCHWGKTRLMRGGGIVSGACMRTNNHMLWIWQKEGGGMVWRAWVVSRDHV
jgi:hypothetical protein